MKRIEQRLIVGILTLIAFNLRAIHLDFQPLWWDEGYSIFFATRDFATMLERTAVDIHPPLYYALLQFWMTFAGKGDVAARLLSVLIGIAAIPLMYALALELFSSARVAFTAALLLALSPLHIYYSQEVRMYGLVTLLGLASVYLFVRLLEMPSGKLKTAALVIAYILVTTAALYTQYYAAFIVAFEIIVAAVVGIRRFRIPNSEFRIRNYFFHWLIAWLAIAALYLPWVIFASGKLYAYVASKVAIEKYQSLDPLTFLAQHLAAFSVGHLTALTGLEWGAIILAALALFGVFARTQEPEAGRSPLLPRSLAPALFFLVPLALGWLVNLLFPFHPIRAERLLLLALPGFLLLVALGVDALWNRRALAISALLALCAFSALSLFDFYNAPRYPNDDYRPLIGEMQKRALPGDIFLAIYPWQIGYLESYYAGAPLEIVETPNDAWINNPAQMRRDVDALLARQPRVWLPALQTQGRILEDALDAELRPRAYSVIDTWFGTTRLELFQRAEDPPRQVRVIAFEENIALTNWGASSERIVAGEEIARVLFDWGAAAPTGLNASLRLVDQKGNVWAQDDREIARGVQRIGFIVPMGMPPGEYDLRVALYRVRDGSALHLANDSSQKSVSLTRVQIAAPARANLAAIPQRVDADFLYGIRLVGYEIAQPAKPGQVTPVILFWQVSQPIAADYAISIQVQDDRGNIFADAQSAPAFGAYPMSRWRVGEIVRDPQSFMLRGETPDGEHFLIVGIVDPKSGARIGAKRIGSIAVKGRARYFGAPSPSNKLDARLGDVARLVGYDLQSDGRSARLVLYWRALASTPNSYTVFVHVVDAQGNIIAQGDAIPGAGALPTTSWVTDEYLADLHEFSIPRDATPGEYRVWIGMYDPKSNARLPVFDLSNQMLGDYIELSTRINVR